MRADTGRHRRRPGDPGRATDLELRTFWRGYVESRSGPIGLALLAAVALVAALAPVLAPVRPEAFTDALLAPPGPGHPFGTDHLGREIFSGVVYGTRVSLLLGVVSAAISAVVGTVVGAVAGYAGGWIDEILSRLIDVFLMIPVFFLVLVVIMLFGNSLPYVMTVIGLTIWPANARLMRAQALSLRERTFVRAAVALGEAHGRILARHIIPHGIYPVVANTTLQVAGAILTEAGLSFLGLGDPNVVSWGRMIYEGRVSMPHGWWTTLFPGLAIVVTVMAFYLIGDGLNHALNPQARERGA